MMVILTILTELLTQFW